MAVPKHKNPDECEVFRRQMAPIWVERKIAVMSECCLKVNGENSARTTRTRWDRSSLWTTIARHPNGVVVRRPAIKAGINRENWGGDLPPITAPEIKIV